MPRLYKITHLINGAQHTATVEAEDAAAAQELFIDNCEAIGVAHGTILSICAAGAV